ncbi:MAG: hypothetical protein B7X59_05245 [Polaromonas sp. 39-63-203]|jgi:hypothetical protein|uniref:hypothetical protein n=1 Tax=Polaromonas sp. TaxID=1869339 RepID=UPI000BD48EC3|nr:hypothetical protein [Polaromonas sp.]OYY52456.1 MAG: hypothetical protein B7Y54_06940 [Polaromonas sp. 35-63-240]OYZ73924.1 MAG: hypothetical protein B7Y03_14830 [Polaromonas sp. 24-62-144]OZA98707.1 MAG: hypothetical protein B7X59_05245 [Polaromonas sp. 39-63-203]HQS30697.1 hypothetical protein [Polaromonas sp.]HQS92710.1 hypothetical protein [Polaromonas sp.]
MTVISIRGIDEKAILRLKKQAQQEGSSLNSLVVRLLETVAGVRSTDKGPQRFDDLDALQGTWSVQDARDFESVTGDFAQVDTALWK